MSRINWSKMTNEELAEKLDSLHTMLQDNLDEGFELSDYDEDHLMALGEAIERLQDTPDEE